MKITALLFVLAFAFACADCAHSSGMAEDMPKHVPENADSGDE